MTQIRLQPMATNIFLSRLVESIAGDASKAQNQAQQLAVDLKADGMDVTDDEVQAAMLGALIDADGKVEDVDVSDVEKIASDIKEGRLYEGGGVLGTIHLAGDVLGNAAFIHVLAEGIQKLTGKNVDEKKLQARLEKIFGLVKKISGFVAHQIEKAFEWVAKKFGASVTGQKIAGISGLLIMTICMFAVGVIFFPSITSTTAFIFTTIALIGKGAEMYQLIKKLIDLLGEEFKQGVSATFSGAMANK
jgi:hypothetical protein